VQVTSAEPSGTRCNVTNWARGDFNDVIVSVLCWHAGGFNIPENAAFIVTYAEDGNILGLLAGHPPAGHESEYAWADQPGTVGYQLNPTYLYSSSGSAGTVSRMGPGSYWLNFPDADFYNAGTTQVTTYGSGQQFCNTVGWGEGIVVRCYDWDGTPADAQYGIAFTGY
jgi:hypothetical protein